MSELNRRDKLATFVSISDRHYYEFTNNDGEEKFKKIVNRIIKECELESWLDEDDEATSRRVDFKYDEYSFLGVKLKIKPGTQGEPQEISFYLGNIIKVILSKNPKDVMGHIQNLSMFVRKLIIILSGIGEVSSLDEKIIEKFSTSNLQFFRKAAFIFEDLVDKGEKPVFTVLSRSDCEIHLPDKRFTMVLVDDESIPSNMIVDDIERYRFSKEHNFTVNERDAYLNLNGLSTKDECIKLANDSISFSILNNILRSNTQEKTLKDELDGLAALLPSINSIKKKYESQDFLSKSVGVRFVRVLGHLVLLRDKRGGFHFWNSLHSYAQSSNRFIKISLSKMLLILK